MCACCPSRMYFCLEPSLPVHLFKLGSVFCLNKKNLGERCEHILGCLSQGTMHTHSHLRATLAWAIHLWHVFGRWKETGEARENIWAYMFHIGHVKLYTDSNLSLEWGCVISTLCTTVPLVTEKKNVWVAVNHSESLVTVLHSQMHHNVATLKLNSGLSSCAVVYWNSSILVSATDSLRII